MKISSKYATRKALVKGHKMFSINRMEVAKEFVNPNSMTNNSKMSSLDLKSVFHTSEGSIDNELVQKFINPQDWVSILDNDLV